jgi:tetratricopeptide (TPR) repeat protein
VRGLAARALGPDLRAPAPWRPGAAWPRSAALLGERPERYDFVTRKLAVAYSDAAARAAWSRGDAAEALAWYEDAARVGFDMPEAHWNVAVAAAAAGDPDRALDALLAARARAPHRAEGAARLAAFLAAAGRYEDAARWFERAFRDEPSPALAADVSRAWTLAGDADRAAWWRGRAAEEGRPS